MHPIPASGSISIGEANFSFRFFNLSTGEIPDFALLLERVNAFPGVGPLA